MTSGCFCREKAVIVVVYAERPQRRRRTDREGGHDHHHPSRRYHFHQNASVNDGRSGSGYNRRAQLLDYARHLRSSALPIMADDRKPKKRSSPPTCLGKWEFLVPTFITSMTVLKITKVDNGKTWHKKSVSTATEMKTLVKGHQVQKKESSLSKLLKTLQKHC